MAPILLLHVKEDTGIAGEWGRIARYDAELAVEDAERLSGVLRTAGVELYEDKPEFMRGEFFGRDADDIAGIARDTLGRAGLDMPALPRGVRPDSISFELEY